MSHHRSASLLALSFTLAAAACAAPPMPDDTESGGAAVSRGQEATGLGGRFVPDDDGEWRTDLDIALPRETPTKAAVTGRLLVMTELDAYDPKAVCALSFAGVLEKPEEDGPVTVDITVADANGTSKGKLRFENVRRMAGVALGKQRVKLTLERPSRPCTQALAARGDIREGISFVRTLTDLGEQIVAYRTLKAEVKKAGEYHPGGTTTIYDRPGGTALAGEPVVVNRVNDDGSLQISCDRLQVKDRGWRNLSDGKAKRSDVNEWPEEVEDLLAIGRR